MVRQTQVLKGMVEHRVDSVVLIPADGTAAADLRVLGDCPFVLLARRVPGLDADYVGANNVAGAATATKHLIEHGCRTLAFIGGFQGSSARTERLAGVGTALREAGMTRPTAARTPICRPDRGSARAAAAALIAQGRGGARGRPVNGVVCFNDVVAFGVLDAIEDAGLVAGVDIRVIGFDDVYDAAAHRPRLSSVAVPAALGGSQAAELLIKRAGGLATPKETIELGTALHARETCGCGRLTTNLGA